MYNRKCVNYYSLVFLLKRTSRGVLLCSGEEGRQLML